MPDITFDMRTRDRETGKMAVTPTALDPGTVGIVVVDPWNFHWCKTSSERVASLIPRMNKCLAIARSLGMPVYLCPTDVANNYVGTRQFEVPLAGKRHPVPDLPDPVYPQPADGGGCACGTD